MAPLLGLGMAALHPPCVQARSGAEALTKGQSYTIPTVTFCTDPKALDSLVALRHAGNLDALPAGCFSPSDAAFAQAFKAFIPDHKIAGVAVPEKLSRPNPNGTATCRDPQSGTAVKCSVRVIRSGFIAGTFVGTNAARIPAFIEVGFGIEVVDARSGALQFAPLPGQPAAPAP